MRKIWEFYETMDELVYVSDTDSHELIYMNKKALLTYGFHSLADLAGKKCYDVLQNDSVPCSICNNHELKPGYFMERRQYHPILERQVLRKDTLITENEKRYRMTLFFDVGSQDQQSDIINLEAKINEGLRVALQHKTPSQSLEVLLEFLGKALGGERTYIFERNENGCDDNTYEWVANGISSEKHNLQNLPAKICANWYRDFRIGKHIVIRNLEDIRESDPLQYDNLKRQNIHALIVVPLYDEETIVGFYGIDNPPVRLLDYASDMLQIMAHFIISSLKRRNLIRELEEMSYRDQLTGIGNRHAMNKFVDNMRKEQSVGIVYCDVTGLKQMNDRKGHAWGDKLIIDACDCLKENFGKYSLFRIGGDEMIALCTQIDESALWQQVEQLRKSLRQKSVHMAVGGLWEKNSLSGVDRLIAEAERRMYQDKASYYMKYGTDRRHSMETVSGWT